MWQCWNAFVHVFIKFVVCTHRGTLGTCTMFYSTLYLLSFKCACSVNTLKANENKKGPFLSHHTSYRLANLWITKVFCLFNAWCDSMADMFIDSIKNARFGEGTNFFTTWRPGLSLLDAFFSPRNNTYLRPTRTKMCRNIWNISELTDYF